ncbi:MAG: hypothetical protein AAGG51_28900 [Cyanobacteria bacterium P01_G01_bin.54]
MTMRKDFDLSKLKPVDLNIGQLNYSCQTWFNRKKGVRGGLIAFSGFYPRGSAGCDEAQFIRWRIDEFCTHPDLFCLKGLVVNLRDLDYAWGDDINVSPLEYDMPYLVVVQESREEAFKGVLVPGKIRFDLRAALAEIDNIIK